MKAITLSVAFAIAWSMQSGVSYAAEDWLDRLSGPGGFWGIVGSYRFLCVSKSQNHADFGKFGVPDPEDTFVTPLSPFHQGSGLLPVIPAPQRPDPTKAAANLTQYRKELATFNCRNDEVGVHGYATTTLGWYWSRSNNLFPHDPENELYQVRIFRWSWEYAVRLNRALDVGAGAGYGRFSGKAFESFSRVFATPISVEFSPFALIGDTPKHRAVSIGLALTWLGSFDQNDFCTAAKTDCARIISFTSKHEFVPRVSIAIDPVLFW